MPPPALRLRNAIISPAVEAVVLKALVKDPLARFPTIQAFAESLGQANQSISLSQQANTVEAPHSKKQPLTSTLAVPMPKPSSSFTKEATVLQAAMPIDVVSQKSQIPFAAQSMKQNANTNPVMHQSLAIKTDKALKSSKSPASPHNKTRSLLWLAIATALLGLLVVLGSVAYAVIGSGPTVRGLAAASSAQVAITPISTDLKHSYTISAVTGTPDTAQHQVQARWLSAQTQSQSQKVPATGVKQIPAVQAKGTLTVDNESCSNVVYPVGSIFTDNDGVQVVTDAVVNIPSACQSGYFLPARMSVSARALKTGASGNIQPQDIRDLVAVGDGTGATCPASTALSSNTNTPTIALYAAVPAHTFLPDQPLSGGGYSITCNLAAFTGGQDASTQTIVQQSDIDGATYVSNHESVCTAVQPL